MNKYQEYIFRYHLGKDFIIYRCYPTDCGQTNKQYCEFDKTTDSLVIKQDEDINIIDYTILIKVETIEEIIDKVSVWHNDRWNDIKKMTMDISEFNRNQSRRLYNVHINFNDRIEKIKFGFKNNLADDYILNLKYIEADKEAYYSKIENQKRTDLLKTAGIRHSTGGDLVNIYFQPCCDEYEKTEITLFKDGQMLAKYKVDDGVFFKSISGLAYGTYEYIVKQFGKDEKLLLETDKIKFSISARYYGGRIII